MKPKHCHWAACALLLGSTAIADVNGDILGQRPTYVDRAPSRVPNGGAISRRIWAPGLDDGFVPQGLTSIDGKLLMVAYRSTQLQPGQGLSRVFQIDPATGATMGHFDLPADVGHPGGLAYGEGSLFVADAGKLLRVDAARSFATHRAVLMGRREVDGRMGPSFLAYFDGSLWFGRFVRPSESSPRLYQVALAGLFDGGPEPLRPKDAARSIPLPLNVQGATFDDDGRLWLSASLQSEGWLYQLDQKTGRVLARHPMPAGMEDLASIHGNALWSVGESGKKRWLRSPTFYPLLFEVQLGALEPAIVP